MLHHIFILKLLLLSIFLSLTANALSKTTSTVNDSNWSYASTWDNGLPVSGDEVIINHQVVLDVNIGVNDLNLTVNYGASLSGAAKYLQIWNSGVINNNGIISIQYYDGVANVDNFGNWTCAKVFTTYGAPQVINHPSGQIEVGTYFGFYGESSVINQGILNAPKATTSNMAAFDGSSLENTGTILAKNLEIQCPLNNYGEILITNNFEQGNYTFYNYNEGIVAVGNIYSTWSESGHSFEMYNYGEITVTGNSTFYLSGNIYENHNYFEVYKLSGGKDFLNEGEMVVRNNISSFYGTGFTFTNGNHAQLNVGGNLIVYDTYSIINNGYLEIGGNATMSGGTITNNGVITEMGTFTSDCQVVNDGAIYCIGTGDFVNNWSSSLTSTTCGHINVGCNTFINRSSVTGNMNIHGELGGSGTYDATVTYLPYCFCDLGLTYTSISSGSWDEFDVCNGETGVWSLLQISPNPIYEYPKVFGNVIINDHDINIDEGCDQPISCDNLTINGIGKLTIETSKTLTINK